MFGRPAVGVGAAVDGIEVEDVGDCGKDFVTRHAGSAAGIANDGDRRRGCVGHVMAPVRVELVR